MKNNAQEHLELKEKLDSIHRDYRLINSNKEESLNRIILSLSAIAEYENNELRKANKNKLSVLDVHFYGLSTVVSWSDGTKTKVRCRKDDTYDRELGLAMAMSKKLLGNNRYFKRVFDKYVYSAN